MGWIVIIEEVATGQWMLVEDDMHIAADDPDYGADVHLIPLSGAPESTYLSFGIHEPSRSCPCRPKIEAGISRNKVIHKDVIN